jgi:serine phosphatase RsbU (regulator of sigma subunit)
MNPFFRLTPIGARGAAFSVLALCLGMQILAEYAGSTSLRALIFDGYQRLAPRVVKVFPVRVVDVDEQSLRAYGQWPWPRERMARLVAETARLGALAVGLDVMMPEPGRFSPALLAHGREDLDPELRRRLAEIPSNDALLGDALARVRSVVARVGRPDERDSSRGQPVRYPPIVVHGADPLPHLAAFRGVTLNVPEVERAATGHGLVNALPDVDGVIRRVPVVARVGDRIAPSLALELLRVASGAPLITVHADLRGVQGVGVAEGYFPVDPDGAITLHFAPGNTERRLSALHVLSGELAANALAGQVAIIGVTALGTADAPPTPISGRMDGVEIQAQVLESLLTHERLVRPGAAPWIEAAALLLSGLLLIVFLPRMRPRRAPILAAVLLLGLAAGAWAAFAAQHWLLDPGLPMVSTVAVCLTLLVSLFARETRRARALNAALQVERVSAARLGGELDAARDIQMGILPDPALVGLPPSVSVAVRLQPARSVGGDLYDLFMVDRTRVFFAVGDVSGKGIPASLFMALSKTLCKSVMMRAGGTVAQRLSIANAEIARENPQMMFVTMAAGLLDTASGELELCIAGHDAPWLLRSEQPPRELDADGGPPLCVMDDFDYPTEHFRLESGDTLVLSTDGISEAMDPGGNLYGRARLAALLAALDVGADPQHVVDAVLADVLRFADGGEPADDLTLLVLRYHGPVG